VVSGRDDRIDRWLPVCDRLITAHAEWREPLARWTSSVADYLYRGTRAALPVTSPHLALHQLHMTLNRLGILPAEEVLLGQVAAEREQGSADGSAASNMAVSGHLPAPGSDCVAELSPAQEKDTAQPPERKEFT
jgi:hypothetical protein